MMLIGVKVCYSAEDLEWELNHIGWGKVLQVLVSDGAYTVIYRR